MGIRSEEEGRSIGKGRREKEYIRREWKEEEKRNSRMEEYSICII